MQEGRGETPGMEKLIKWGAGSPVRLESGCVTLKGEEWRLDQKNNLSQTLTSSVSCVRDTNTTIRRSEKCTTILN